MRLSSFRGVGEMRSGSGRTPGVRRCGPGPAEDRPCADIHQGRRADLPGEVRGVPSARLDRADVARDLRGGAAVGEVDQGARRRAADAAVAHRQDRRHPAVQERSLADRRARSTRSCAGSTPARRRATRRTCRRRRSGQRRRCGISPSMFGGPTGSHHQVAAVHDAARSAGRVVQAASSRPGSPSRAGCARSRFGRPRSRAARSRTTRSPACSRTTRSTTRRRGTDDDDSGVTPARASFMEWAVGKQGEIMRPEQRQADAARLADHLGHPLLRRPAKRSPTSVELGIYFYPKGQEPKYRQVLAC